MKMRWANFLGGLALSPRVGEEGSYRYGVGVMIDNKPGVLRAGGTIVEDTQTKMFPDEQKLGEAHILSYSSSESRVGVSYLSNISGDLEYDDTTTDPTAVNGLTTMIDTNRDRYMYILYERSGNTSSEIARNKMKDNSNIDLSQSPADKDTTFLTGTIGSTVTGASHLYNKSQRIYLAGGMRVHYYDGSDGTFNKDKLDLPFNSKGLGEFGNYLVIQTNSTLYLWDGESPSWNYSIPVEGKMVDIERWNGNLYLVSEISSRYYLSKVNRDLRSTTTIRQIPSKIDDVGIGSGLIYFGDFKMTSNNLGIYMAGIVAGYLIVYRYGVAKAGLKPKLTIEYYKEISGVSGSYSIVDIHAPYSPYDPHYNDRIYLVTDENGTRRQYRFGIYASGGTSSIFETTEKEVPETEDGYSEGIAKNLYIYPQDSGTATDVSVVLDGTEVTLENSASMVANQVKKFRLGGRKFKNAAVHLEKELPDIYRIELEFDTKSQV